MAEKKSGSEGPFDVGNLHQLVRLMRRYDLTAIDLIDDKTKIRLRRRGPEVAAPSSAPVIPSAQVFAPPPPAAPIASTPVAPAPSTDVVIDSPMVGTYYDSPSPDSPSFVTPGTAVRPDATVCVIEAMKVFTDIPAGISGTISEVLVKNGQSVEFGQPLFRVKPA